MIDRISTNHTFFFREKDHFDLLTAEILPKILQKLPGPDRISGSGRQDALQGKSPTLWR
jgi:chemotaxis methyl-accepting protein methylase